MSISTSATPNPLNYTPDFPSSTTLSNRPSDNPEWRQLRRRAPLRTLLEDTPRSSLAPAPTASNIERAPPRLPEAKYFALYCGGPSPANAEDDILPSHRSNQGISNPFPPFTDDGDEYLPCGSSPSLGHTNGCGTLLHLRAVPKARLGVFTAKSFINSSEEAILIPLDTKYFVDLDFKVGGSGSVQLVKSSCGCERIGIGCAVCGNPIGTRFKPCKNATTGTDSALRHMNSKPVGPEGRAYWRVMRNKASSIRLRTIPSTVTETTQDDFSEFYVYTFFPSAVTSYPNFSFPNQPSFSQESSPSSSSGSSMSSFQQTFFVDTSPPIPPSGYGRDLESYRLERRPGASSAVWSNLGEEWQPPSPVQLTFVEQRDNRFSGRTVRSGNDFGVEGLQQQVSGRGWSDSWNIEPSIPAGGSTDDWDKDVWENRIDVASGR